MSSYGHPAGYQFKSAVEKLHALAPHFPGLYGDHVEELAAPYAGNMPEGAEELLVCPKPSKVIMTGSYHEALDKALRALGRITAFRNLQECELGPERMRLTEKTAAALAKLEKETPGDYLVIPAQMGSRYMGDHLIVVRCYFSANEFGLGPFEVACYLLSSPEWLSVSQDTGIDCAGVEYREDLDDDDFDECLRFFCDIDALSFLSFFTSVGYAEFGSASGFLR
jgi:hypothetical protein